MKSFVLLLLYFLSLMTIYVEAVSNSTMLTRSNSKKTKWERRYKFLKPERIRFKGTKKWDKYTAKPKLSGGICSGGSSQFLGHSPVAPALTPFDQGKLSSCVANVLAMAAEIAFKKAGGQNLNISRLWLYYIGRMQCLAKHDAVCSGAWADDVILNLKRLGFIKEDQWPYDVNIDETNDYVNLPPKGSRPLARQNRDLYVGRNGIELFELDSIDQVEQMIDDGIPVFLGYNRWDGIENDNGIIDFSTVSGPPISAHAVLAIGYSDTHCMPPPDLGQHVIYILNSWGSQFGENGVGSIPRSFFSDESQNNLGANRAFALRFTDGKKVI